MNAVIAQVYIPGGASKAIRTFPGQKLNFVGGKAEVRHEWHMPHVLAMPEARVQVSYDWREWIPKWIDMMPGYDDKVKATIEVLGTDDSLQDETNGAWDAIDLIAVGRHKTGCVCKICVGARRRMTANAMEALPV
jgi:hypothetical protein